MAVALVLIIGVGVLFGAILAVRDAVRNRRRTPGWRSSARIAAAFVMLYGLLGFFGAALSATGGLRWVPSTTPFPMGWVDGVVRDREGNLYCPSAPFGRIQVYDRDKRLLHGWYVDASGGSFRIHMNPEERLEVVTARQRRWYVFDLRGNQISRTSYAPKSYADFAHWTGEPEWIPQPILLLPWSSPLGSGGLALLGILVLNLTDSRRKRSPRPSSAPGEGPVRTKPASGPT